MLVAVDLVQILDMGGVKGRRSLDRLVAPLRKTKGIQTGAVGQWTLDGEEYRLPRFTFSAGATDPIRLGVFAAIHGDEPAGAVGAVQLLLDLADHPEWAANYEVTVYPVCNPTGFEDNTRYSRRGRDLNREFWKGSAEPEVQALEAELLQRHYHGLVQLHADDTSEGLYGFVRGHTLTENLLRPALREAARILPRNINATIDGFAARDSIIYKHYEGVLAAPTKITPMPFEIIFETPHLAPVEKQVAALNVAIRTIMTEYRSLMSFAQDI